MQPGDNFVAAATTNSTQLSAVNVTAQGLQDGAGNPLPDGVISITPMLTVWRNLHIQADTMGAVVGDYVTGNITNFAQSELTVDTNLNDGSLDLDTAAPPFGNGRFENGSITAAGVVPALVQANGDHRVDSALGFGVITQANMQFTGCKWPSEHRGHHAGLCRGCRELDIQCPGCRTLTRRTAWANLVGGSMSIAGGSGMAITAIQDTGTVAQFDTAQITASNLAIPFKLVDDDVIPPGALDLPDNSLMATAFGQGYIRPVYDVPNNRNVPFILNVNTENQVGAYDHSFTAQPQNPDPAYWIIYNLSAYQGLTTDDWDPNAEGGTFGIAQIGGFGVRIFKETLRDVGAHERTSSTTC
jgi:hypothetical protein